MSDPPADRLTQGDFTIERDKSTVVRIGERREKENKVVVNVAYNGKAPVSVRVTVTARFGQDLDGRTLLASEDDRIVITGDKLGAMNHHPNKSKGMRSWQNQSGSPSPLNPGDTVKITLAEFDSNTPSGVALIDVLVQTKSGATWTPAPANPPSSLTLRIPKVDRPADRLTQGDFTIERDKSTVVRIGERREKENKVVVNVAYNGKAPVSVRVTVTARFGQDLDGRALLASKDDRIVITGDKLGAMNHHPNTSTWMRSWQNQSGSPSPLNPGDTVKITLAEFDSNTPSGVALIDVLVQTKSGAIWTPAPANPPSSLTLRIPKEVPTGAAVVRYFTVDPPFVLRGGDTEVQLAFLATGCKSVSLYRNNQQVSHSREITLGGGQKITETLDEWSAAELEPASGEPRVAKPQVVIFRDKPSITSVYRLVPQAADSATPPPPPIERSVQVASSGWNTLALPQGYPTRLFVASDFRGPRTQRLYGIFVDRDGEASLHSSATGIDDWRREPGAFPKGMAMSPGVTFGEKLWLIGGSSANINDYKKEVWCYEKDQTDNTRGDWKQGTGLPEERAGHACVVVPIKKKGLIVEELWVLGGRRGARYFEDVLKLSGNGNEWTRVAKSNKPWWSGRYRHAAAVRSMQDGNNEVWIFGGQGEEARLHDIWCSSDGVSWTEGAAPKPAPGTPLAAALVTAPPRRAGDDQRLFLAGTFWQDDGGNVSFSRLYEWQSRNEKWEAEEVVGGWERFEGSDFYMQAVAFNGMLFVWSLHAVIPDPPPRLNVLIP